MRLSLIELLIVVAIIAPWSGWRPDVPEEHRRGAYAKAKENLDTIRNALTLYDSQNRR